MTSEIDKLYNLIIDTKAKYPNGKIVIHKVIDEQMTIYNELISELTGKSFNDCYHRAIIANREASNNVVAFDEMKTLHTPLLEPLGQTKNDGDNDDCCCVLM